MRAIATKQPTNDSAKQKKNGDKGRSRSVSPLSTGMPLLQGQCACGGGCPRCKQELGIQTKLKISEPGDKYEQEADRIADEVMRMPEPSVQRQVEPEEEEDEMVQRKAITDQITPLVQRQVVPEIEEEEGMVQRKVGDLVSSFDSQPESSEIPPIVHKVINSPGQPLNTETRTFMESRFGHDFSQVRVHNDVKAAESARAVNALAYTVGQNIVFGTGKYSTKSKDGQQLLAHELTHTIQQEPAHDQGKLRIDHLHGNLEQKARAVALSVATNQSISCPIETTHSSLIQRDAGGVKQSKYGDTSVDVLEGLIIGGQWQDAIDTLSQISDDNGILKVLGELKQIRAASSGEFLLKLLIRNKPATTPSHLNSLLDRADKSVRLNPMHSDERLGNRDKLATQTFRAEGDPIPDVIVAAEQEPRQVPVKRTLSKEFSIFIPKGVSSERNQVHIFFTPFVASLPDGAAGFVAQQGLRAESDASAWILIAVPALDEPDQPNFVTISTSEIKKCLTEAGRKTNIDAIRISAHSRGHRGLENTIGLKPGAKPLIDLKLVEKITVFDASYKNLGKALTSHQKDLTAIADPKKSGQFISGSVQLYDVTVANISGLPGIKLDVRGIRALSYARLIQEGTARGQITPADINSINPDVSSAINRILSILPSRGSFSTKQSPLAGKVNLQKFIKKNQTDLMQIDSPMMKTFITAKNLDWESGLSRDDDAHHWFVAELAHEAVE